MEIVRNSINISGLAEENSLPSRVCGQMIQYAETETIFIPEEQPEVSSIFQVILKVNVRESRRIKTPTGYTVILDGTKKIKIIYVQKSESGKANFFETVLPFNTFIEIQDDINIENIDIFILDAYFDLIGERKIYSNILYLIDVVSKQSKLIQYQKISKNEIQTDNIHKNEIYANENEITQIKQEVDERNKKYRLANDSAGLIVDLEEEYL